MCIITGVEEEAGIPLSVAMTWNYKWSSAKYSYQLHNRIWRSLWKWLHSYDYIDYKKGRKEKGKEENEEEIH